MQLQYVGNQEQKILWFCWRYVWASPYMGEIIFTTFQKRVVILGLLCVGSFALTEWRLRQQYEIVPSLSVSMTPFTPEGRPATISHGPDPQNCHSHPLANGQSPPISWQRSIEGTLPTLKIFVVGDSGALGSGVRPEETYAYQLAKKIHSKKKQHVALYNLGYNAAGYCIYLQELHRHLDLQKPDLVVVHMFADDLEQKALVMSGGVLRADPGRLESDMLRTILGKSFATNWVWWKLMTWMVTQTTDGGTKLPKWVERGPRLIPDKTLANFSSSVVHLRDRLKGEGIPHTFFLAAPAGMSLCPDKTRPTSECAWLKNDQNTIAKLLNETDVPWLDLRMLWGDSKIYILRQEHRFYREFGRLPVHPNQEGHRKILEAIWPKIEPLME